LPPLLRQSYTQKVAGPRRLRVESLESRALLAGHSAGASFGLANAVLHQDVPSVTAHVASLDSGANVAASQQTVLTAHLADSNTGSTATGNAVFHTGTDHGQTKSQLAVEINHALDNTTYDVAVNGTALGTFKTNSNGAGHLPLFSNPKGSQAALPSGFTVSAGDSLTITAEGTNNDTLSGDFAKPTPPQVVNLKAVLTDSQRGTGKGVALYHSVTKNGTTQTELEIVVTNAGRNASLEVFLNGGTTPIGTVKTDAHGRGTLELSDPSLIIISGDTIMVGTLTGTFSTPRK
jgi:hypothetical protein